MFRDHTLYVQISHVPKPSTTNCIIIIINYFFVNITGKQYSIVLIGDSLVITEVEYYFMCFWLSKQRDVGGKLSKTSPVQRT